MRILDEEELEGVLAHELSHVKNRDVLISTIAATLAGAITYLAHMAQWAAMFGGRSRDDDEGGSNPIAMILLAILAPIAALLVQMAVSRSREFQADATGQLRHQLRSTIRRESGILVHVHPGLLIRVSNDLAATTFPRSAWVNNLLLRHI